MNRLRVLRLLDWYIIIIMCMSMAPHINLKLRIFQVFGEAVIGKAGLVIFSLLVALATFGTAHSSQFTAARSAWNCH